MPFPSPSALRGVGLASAAALALAFAPAGAAAEAAVITPFHNVVPESYSVGPFGCGTTTGDGVESDVFKYDGQVVTNSAGYAVDGTSTITGTVIYSDGSYVQISGHSHFEGSSHSSTQTFTSAGPETHTLYAPDGSVISTLLIRGVEHTTIDLATGKVTNVDHVRFNCLP